MQRALDHFRTNIGHVQSLGALHAGIKAQTTSILDLSDILRAQLVMAVSALDHYIHEIAALGMLEVYNGVRPETEAFLNFRVSIRSVRQGLVDPRNAEWLENEIREQLGWQSFQQPDKLADAIRLISNVRLWEEVATELGSSTQDVKRRLNLIIDRRNKIAHEADMDPTFPGARWPIDETLASDAINFISETAEAIHKLCV